MGLLQEENKGLVYRFDGEVLRIEGWGKHGLRVRSVMMGEPSDTEYALLEKKQENVMISIDENRGCITNGKITAVLTIHNRRCRVAFYNQKKELLLQEKENCGALNLAARHFKPVIGGDYCLTLMFDSEPEEKLYGMGQYQQEFLNIKNCTLELAHRNSQASVPFVLSNLGYGFLWNNPAIGHVNFSKNVTEWRAESTRQMDYWITAGDSPNEIEENYAGVTGTVPMMPEYGLGFWQCKLRYWNQKQLLDVAREYKRRNIPLDVIVCDFFHWKKMGDFCFEKEFFPDPEQMVKELKEMGIELMVSVWPQIDVTGENFLPMKEQGLLVKTEKGVNVCMRFGGDSVFFDATNPKAREFVWEKCKKNYYGLGIQTFWLDEAEPEYGVYDFENYRYFIGTNLSIGNIYPLMFSKTFYDGMQSQGQDKIVNLVRCAWAGSQRYGALVWSGDIHSDYKTFRRQLCAGLNMGIAGIPWWTTDIGGFSGGDPAEEGFRKLLVRWFEWGTFCPVMRLHGDRRQKTELTRKDGTSALFTGGDNEIWSFGEEVLPILEKYIRIREILRPYTRSLMEEAHRYGRPVLRTMFYEFPEDAECWEWKEQYMFGSKLLIAPMVYENQYEREVYLPKNAEWIDTHTGKRYTGGITINITAELDVIPVFEREDCTLGLNGVI